MFDKEKTLYIACDHAGFPLKEFLRDKLIKNGFKVHDFGAHSEESVDYPDMIHPLASIVNSGNSETGVIICGSGNGAQMTANKYLGVRAALCWDKEQAELARQHNNANIISIPGRFIDFEKAWEMLKVFLNTSFEGGRHERRVRKISEVINS